MISNIVGHTGTVRRADESICEAAVVNIGSTTMVDLYREHADAVGRMTQADLDHMVAVGVSGPAYVGAGVIGKCRIATCPGGTYVPDRDGDFAFIQPVVADRFDTVDVYGYRNGLVDMIAWRTHAPDRWWFRRDVGWALGETAILNAANWTEPVRIWRTPLAWLRSGCEGAVVLDEKIALPYLIRASEVIAEDIDHGRYLQKVLTPPPPPMPNITIEVAA